MVLGSGHEKSVQEIDNEFQRIKERLKKEKNDGSRSKLKSMVESLNFDNLDTFGENCSSLQQHQKAQKSSNRHAIHSSNDFEEISLYNDEMQVKQNTSIEETQKNMNEQANFEYGDADDGMGVIHKSVDLNQGYAQCMMEKFSAPQEIED